MRQSNGAPAPLCFISLLLLLTTAHSWSPVNLPSPQKDANGVCGTSKKASAVCDPDGYLSTSERAEIDGLINMIAEGSEEYDVSQCGDHVSGHQVAVLILSKMDSVAGHDNEQRAAQFARDIHDSWGVGDPACQNGIVLLIAVDAHRVQISTGKGARRFLGDRGADAIALAMRDNLRRGKYGAAILLGVHRIGLTVSGRAVFDSQEKVGTDPVWPFALFTIFCFGCSACCSGSSNHRRQSRYALCKAALRRIDDDTAAARAGVFVASTCPICLEVFSTPAPRQSNRTHAVSEVSPDAAPVAAPDAAPDNAPADDVEASLLSASDSARTDSDARVALPCGHAFHMACINDWVDGSRSSDSNRRQCPVCRASVDGNAPRDAGTLQDSELAAFDDERRFRIRRTHDIYPDYVTYHMMNNFTSNRNVRIQSHSSFVRLNPVLVAQARSAGSGGSSFSFGGGSSMGGGGGGGSW